MLPELKLQPLRYVLAITDQGGFHAAAKQLHRSQPAISMAVRDLEERLGQPLFEKGSGKAALTPYGQWCLPRFRELVAHHERVSRDALAMACHQAGRVDIATVPSVASRLMPGILASFVSDYPGIEINLQDGNSELVSQRVLSGEVGYVLIRNGTSRLLEGSPATELLEHSTLFISNMISLTAMLEAGIGITTLPRLAFQEEHARLRFVPLAAPRLERRIGLICRAGVSLSPAAAAMQHHVMTYLTAPSPG
ncbi:MAG: LysR family transcriptional regulator [Halomonas sp.]|nr:LysR family transcriptional regulator [Halomonas sp.]